MCQNLRVRFGKLLSLFSAFSVALLVMPLFLQARPVRASADTGDTNSITLSYEQSLALFGTSLECTIYDGQNGSYQSYLSYVGTSDDYQFISHFNDFYIYDTNGAYPVFTSVDGIPDYQSRRYLIYGISSSGINIGDGTLPVPVPWPSPISPNTSSAHTNISCSFPFPVESISGLKFSVFYTSKTYISGGYVNPNVSSLSLIKSDGILVKHPFGRSTNSSRQWSTLLPMYKPAPSSPELVPESNRISFSAFPCDYSSDENFSITGFQLGLNAVDSPELNSNLYGAGIGYMPFVYIQCPTLSDYDPPVVTTVTSRRPSGALTGVTGQPAQTVDLSNLESGVAAIVQQEQYNADTLDWIGNNTMITANNLYVIANKLQDIYDLMVQRGEIAVNLMPAEPLAELRTDIHSQIHDSLSSFTTSQIPNDYRSDMNHSFSFVNMLYTKFTSGGLSFFAWLGVLSLSMYVVIWFIFRGRG